MPDRTIWMSQKITDVHLFYPTRPEYYRVERLQDCCWLNQSMLLRTLSKTPLWMGDETYIELFEAGLLWCHKKWMNFVRFTRLSRSTSGSSGFKTVVGSTNRNCCVFLVKLHSKWATDSILSYLRPGYCDATRNQWTSFALQDSPGVLPGRAASKLLLAERNEVVAYSM